MIEKPIRICLTGISISCSRCLEYGFSGDVVMIVQEVFIAIYEKSVLKNYQGSLKAYLYTSVRNRCYNYLRDAKIEDRNMALYAEAAVYSDNVDMIDREEILEKIREVLDELPGKCREVCLLRFVHGYKYCEISEQLGMNENTVKVQLHRGLEKLKRCFSDYDFALVLFMLTVCLENV
ncbi:MAG: RNA polymerase sigma factor [Butyricimonas faecihominis]